MKVTDTVFSWCFHEKFSNFFVESFYFLFSYVEAIIYSLFYSLHDCTFKYLVCLFNFVFCPLIRKFRHLVIFLFLGLKIIFSVLLTFSESLFVRIYSLASFRSLLPCLLSCIKKQSDRRRFVSSAKWCTALKWIALWKSFMKIINKRGPNTKPCETP